MPMHENQLDISPETVRRLLARQHPQWGSLTLRPVRSHGTVNLLFRLGDDLVLRFPLQGEHAKTVRTDRDHEVAAARMLVGKVSVATPEPVALGEPGEGYPLPWSVYRWLAGTEAGDAGVADSRPFARGLARFVGSVRAIDTQGAVFAGAGRGGLLADHDDDVAHYLSRSHGLVDVPAVAALWARLRLTSREQPDTMTHGDLMPGNVLALDQRLVGVIDVGGAGPADPALDLQPAWNLLGPLARQEFRDTLSVDDAEWDRGRGWALAQAIGCLAYYRVSNPVMSQTAARTLAALLA